MKLKQGIVNCLCSTEKGETVLVPTKGWITDNDEFGFCKVDAKTWKAIDIETGTGVCVRATRKECVSWVEENLQMIREHPNRAKWIEIKERAPINGT